MAATNRLHVETDSLLGGWSLVKLSPAGFRRMIANYPTAEEAAAARAKLTAAFPTPALVR